ncbi:DNA replication/repair protein RecF [Parvularcula lutaonensis]|uniref:DNA replication and repair protein RecF n=1 Tax=Parvularcula lutaonensis TaxID=491923 RepID=A0ABV7ME78_9PROT|nr:DNA replication/repair protein RecF [Parvularcula lutaonensis]GGY49913.1 DNA replication and repair protein RecF [Parvularcula lutaonensis]
MRRITALTLRDIRSYEAFEARLSGRSVVITGPNGAGKTNILETLTLFGAGRGLRGAKLSDVVRHGAGGAPGAAITLSAEDEEPMRLVVSVVPPRYDRREVRIDGEVVKSAGTLSELIRFLWMTPAMDRLFMDAPSERRRFLDRIAAAGSSGHAIIAGRYEKAMKQRMALLEQGGDPSLLTHFEREMADAGIALSMARRETAESLAAGYEALRQEAFPRATVFIEGDVELLLAEHGEEQARDRFAERLARNRRIDRDARRTIIGPHRSDLVVTHEGKQMPARQCSTGEQKALLTGLVLARAQAAKERGEGTLVLLLDEIVAHLDETRREALAETLHGLGLQAFLTGTDPDAFAPFLAHMDHLRPDQGGKVSNPQDS